MGFPMSKYLQNTCWSLLMIVLEFIDDRAFMLCIEMGFPMSKYLQNTCWSLLENLSLHKA